MEKENMQMDVVIREVQQNADLRYSDMETKMNLMLKENETLNYMANSTREEAERLRMQSSHADGLYLDKAALADRVRKMEEQLNALLQKLEQVNAENERLKNTNDTLIIEIETLRRTSNE